MLLSVRHETTYAYSQPVWHSIRLLRLTPRPHDGQAVRAWQVAVTPPRPLASFVDAFGNVTHTHAVTEPHEHATVTASGVVETRDTGGRLHGAAEPMPLAVYLRPTVLTAPEATVRALAAETGALPGIERLHRLLQLVHERVAYHAGVTDVATTAAQALAAGAGVCQDHAHVFLAAVRTLGVPARYVGGYLSTGEGGSVAQTSHAWAEAWDADLGWIGFDPANGVCPDERYVRVGVGLDYASAAPVRGIRQGPGDERLHVAVVVAEGAQQQ
jgi:transglutaminase-like putative cysteine protease